MEWSVVVAVHNDEAVLSSTLLRSPDLQKASKVLCQRGFPSVAAAYNAALRTCKEELLVFIHPDVYLPSGWYQAFRKSLEWLDHNNSRWGVLGLYGVGREGGHRGFLFSTGLGRFVGAAFSAPCEVRTLDEFAFILRRGSGLACDEGFPDQQNHFSATDLCLQGERRNMRSYVLPCFALHNSNHWRYPSLGFWRCYLHMRAKWRDVLPVVAPCATITACALPMLKTVVRSVVRWQLRNPRVVTRVSDPQTLYESLRHRMPPASG